MLTTRLIAVHAQTGRGIAARLTTEHDLAAFDEVEANAHEQSDARLVSFVGDAQYAGGTRCRKEQADCLTDGARRNAATLRGQLERETNFA